MSDCSDIPTYWDGKCSSVAALHTSDLICYLSGRQKALCAAQESTGDRLIDHKLTGLLAAGLESRCPKRRRRAVLLSGEAKKRVCVVR